MQLREAVHTFIQNLNLTNGQQEEAARQHVHLRTQLQRRLSLDPRHQTFLTGSYARSTAIRPLDDIDMFCVLAPEPGQTPGTLSAPSALSKLQRALEATYEGKVTERQNRSINITFSGTGIGYDVVPAFADGDRFQIPDLRKRNWILSNPKVHAERSVVADRAAGDDLRPLTKAVKHWNRRQPEAQRLRSFHLEVMAWEIVVRKPPTRLAGLKDLFDGLAWRMARPVPDPAGLGPDLDEGMTAAEKQAAARQLKSAGDALARAISLDERGQVDAAHQVLYGLFGEPYPTRG